MFKKLYAVFRNLDLIQQEAGKPMKKQENKVQIGFWQGVPLEWWCVGVKDGGNDTGGSETEGGRWT